MKVCPNCKSQDIAHKAIPGGDAPVRCLTCHWVGIRSQLKKIDRMKTYIVSYKTEKRGKVVMLINTDEGMKHAEAIAAFNNAPLDANIIELNSRKYGVVFHC